VLLVLLLLLCCFTPNLQPHHVRWGRWRRQRLDEDHGDWWGPSAEKTGTEGEKGRGQSWRVRKIF